MKKRVISLLLALCMVLAMFPVTAFAAEIVNSGTCGDNLTWTRDDEGTLVITGTGAMANYSDSETPWSSCGGNIKAVVIHNGVTSIGSSAFYGCSSLTSVTIPDSVTSIEGYTFYSCSSLTDITLSESLDYIAPYAFSYCSSLNTIIMRGDMPYIDSWAFDGVTSDVYYPADNATYTDDKMGNFGGTLNWIPSIPSVTSQPKNATADENANARFAVTASGLNLTYQWQYQAVGSTTWTNTTLTGAKTATLSVPATAGRNGCKYRCVVTDASGNVVNSTAATLTVK